MEKIRIYIDTRDQTASLPCESAFYYCQLGNLEFAANSKLYPRLEMADKYYKKAISFDSKFAAPANIGLGNILLSGDDHFTLAKTFKGSYKEQALEFFENGLILLCDEMASLTTTQSLLFNRSRDSDKSDLHLQLLAKMNYLGTYNQTVHGNMKAIQKSLRQVTCHEFSQDGKCMKKGILEDRSLTGFSTAPPANGDTQYYYSLSFHDLTRHEDLWEQDQAVKTIHSSMEILTKNGNSTAEILLTCTCLVSLGELKIPDYSKTYTNSGASFRITYFDLNLAEVEERLNTFESFGLNQMQGFSLLPMTPPNANLTLWEVLEQLNAYKTSSSFNRREHFHLIIKDVNPVNFCLIQRQSQTGVTFLSEMSLLNCKIELYNVETKYLEEFIKIFRDCKIRFTLNIYNLLLKDANEILEHAHMDQEDIQLHQFKELTQLQLESCSPLVEIQELKARGILFLVSFDERKFIPWRTVISIGILAGAQIAVGSCLLITGVGSSVGMGLITEGAVDAITAARLTSTREFNMQEFIAKKAVSIAISCATMGYSAYSNGVSSATPTVAQGVNGVITEAGEQAVTQGITNSNRIYQAGRAGVSAAWKSRLKDAASIAGGVFIRVGVNTSIDLLSKFAFAQVRDKIRKRIEFYWLKTFKNRLCVAFRDEWARDKLRKQKCLNDKVLHIVRKLTGGKYECEELILIWMKVANFICDQVREYSKKAATIVSLIAIVGTYIAKLNEVFTITDTISEVILCILTNQQRALSASDVVCSINQFFKQPVQSVCSALSPVEATTATAAIVDDMSSDDMEKLKRFRSQFHSELPEILDLNRLIIDLITDHLISLADGELFNPLRAPGVQSFVNQLCPGFQLKDDLLLSDLENLDPVEDPASVSLFEDLHENEGEGSAAANSAPSGNDFVHNSNRRDCPAKAEPSLFFCFGNVTKT